MEVNQSNQTPQEVKKEESPWKNIGIGLLMIAFAVFMYYHFDRVEREGGIIRLNRVFALIYALGGKWPVATIITVIGIFTVYSGIKDLSGKKKE